MNTTHCQRARVAIDAEIAAHPPPGTRIYCPIFASDSGVCQGDLIQILDDNIHLSERDFERAMNDPIDRPRFGGRSVIWYVMNDSYKGKYKIHMFDLKCYWSRCKKISVGETRTVHARHVYRFGWYRAEWSSEDNRADVLFEKHYRSNPQRALWERKYAQVYADMPPSPGFPVSILYTGFCPGDTIRFLEVEEGYQTNFLGRREIEALVLRESCGPKTGRITCTLQILACTTLGDSKPLETGATIRRMKAKILRYNAYGCNT